ncbi:MAG TPA: MBL fold metallo-hydrolase RNA specificity domain-containing protein [Candidatus Norongarragalinales archaeon]|jgi:hypothetical protein|nr:MBL fold metallo-hydrolase RNA specificity domain-containing protein [Candidatus Norongarragalinales archaeon]
MQTTLSFLGAAREVGRSSFLFEGQKRTLLDCGIKPQEEDDFPLIDKNETRKLDNVILSHAHLDHAGYLPALYAAGYDGKVIMTKPSRDIVQVLCADYLRLRKERHPYSEKDVNTLLKHAFLADYDVNYGHASLKRELPEHGGLRLHEAGHILGSAMVEMEDSGKKILYTGDVNLRPSRLLEGAKVQGLSADALIIESTYGCKEKIHPGSKEREKQLVDSVNETIKKNGFVIIPTFATGRGQELLFVLENYMKNGAIPRVPIYIAGMVKKILKIYRHNAIFLKKEVQHRILTSEDDPFNSPFFKIPKRKDYGDVFENGPAIIVTTSGMLNGGPVLAFLEVLCGDKNNKLIIVGHQAEGTRGRAIQDGERELEWKGKKHELRMQVEVANFSAHSDHRELVQLARTVKGLKQIFVVHGEEACAVELAKTIDELYNGKVEVIAPKLGESFKI